MVKIRSIGFFVIIFVFLTTLSFSATQDVGTVDSTFNAQLQTTTYLSKTVANLTALPDGKILASGNFNTYNGQPVSRLFRLNADASVDTTFNNNLLADGSAPQMIKLLPDGKILLGGNFTLANGTIYTNALIRLNADGTIDSSFNFLYTGNVYEVKTDASDRLLVTGYINVVVNGATVTKNIIRLTDTGAIDSTFNAPASASCIEKFTPQSNKVLYTCEDIAAQQYKLFRLNEDGTTDNSFTPVFVGNAMILEMRNQPDNKILILSNKTLFRLNENGNADPDFQITNFYPGQPSNIFLQSDGRITFAYSISSPNGVKVVRLLPNGTSDPSFTPYISSSFSAYTVQSDGGVLIGDYGNSSSSNAFIRLLPSGAVDASFNPGGSGFQNINPGKIRAISVLPDNKILIGGDFDKVNNVYRSKIARLNTDSTLDAAFQINTTATGDYFLQILDVYHFAIQSDGKIIVSGAFTYVVNGAQKQNLVRLNSNGSIDPSFNLSLNILDIFQVNGYGQNKPVQRSDGKILVGTTRTDNTTATTVPLLLTADGVKDTSFSPTVFSAYNVVVIFDLAFQTDGKILISGRHVNNSGNNSIQKGFIARLNSDGTVDPGFQAAEPTDKDIIAFRLLQNGQIIIVSGTNLQSNVSRLNSDGSNDSSFNAGSGANGKINAIAVLPDNKILIGGAFSTYNNQPRQNLAMLNADGSLGASLGDVNREVLCITVDKQGRVLIGGQFTSISSGAQNSNGAQNSVSTGSSQQITRSYLARLIISPQTIRPSYFDFDGDGKADVSVFRPSSGVWYFLNSTSGFTATQFGVSTDKIVPADFDGDGKTDVAVYRNGTWYIQRSRDGFTAVSFGAPDDIPVPADFNGDGEAEVAVFRPSNGVWYIYNLTTNQFTAYQFGQAGDVPVVGDYDGDGKADIAVYRPSQGIWYIQRSRDGFTGFQFGASTDKPVPADYDGDGKADIAVYRPSNGTWYLQQSTAGFTGVQFGISTDKPVPADYDGDGKADIAVFRDGTWYIQRSTAGFTGVGFGASTDKPVPNAFIP